jgi:hypothetical protein
MNWIQGLTDAIKYIEQNLTEDINMAFLPQKRGTEI